MGEQSLRCFGPIVWNVMLPEDVKRLTNLEDFKQRVQKWVPQNCACRQCKDYVPNLGFVTLYE